MENLQHQQLKEDTRKILHVRLLQIQLHVNNIVQVKYAAKWFEEDARKILHIQILQIQPTTLCKLNMQQSGLKKMPAGAVRPSGIFVKQRQMVAQPPREERLGMLLLINNQQPQPQPQQQPTTTTKN